MRHVGFGDRLVPLAPVQMKRPARCVYFAGEAVFEAHQSLLPCGAISSYTSRLPSMFSRLIAGLGLRNGSRR